MATPGVPKFGSTNSLEKLKSRLQKQNLSFPSKDDILNSCESDIFPWVNALLNYKNSNPLDFIDNALKLTALIKMRSLRKDEKILWF